MKNLLFILSACLLLSCSNTSDSSEPSSATSTSTEPVVDDRGVGEIKRVTLNDPLDETLIVKGKSIYEIKCAACHRLSDQRVVGPGWEGITTRRRPEWIMNMTLNVEEMLEKDPAAKEMLRECLVRMPNQNLSIEDARAVLEFMYDNDNKIAEAETQ